MRRSRRLLRRLFGAPPGPGLPVPPAPVSPLLIEAHRLFDMGQYEEAAFRFEQLAGQALQAAPVQAPQLLLQAGRARIQAGQVDAGTRLLMQALDLLARQQRWGELGRRGSRVVQGLRERRYERQAAQIAAWLQQQGGSIQTLFDSGGGGQRSDREEEPRRAMLPTCCPSCGGPVDPREVEWADVTTAECPYCGGMIRAA